MYNFLTHNLIPKTTHRFPETYEELNKLLTFVKATVDHKMVAAAIKPSYRISTFSKEYCNVSNETILT